MDITTKILFENSGHSVAVDLIVNEESVPTYSAIIQLAQYMQAVVFNDRVILTARPGRKHSPIEIVPTLLKQESIFSGEVINDFAERIGHAQEQSLKLAESSLRHQIDTQSFKEVDTKGAQLINFISNTLDGPNGEWKKPFWNHVNFVANGRTPYLVEGVNNILSHFNDEDYGNLSKKEKVAIYYLWRCFYNVYLAKDIAHQYSHNYYRTPIVDIVYRSIRHSLFQPSSILNEDAPDFIENITKESLPIWHYYLPSLLANVLERVDNRKQIEYEILELRNSPEAIRYREYHRELISEFGVPTALKEIEKKIDMLMKQWKNIDAPVSLTFAVNLPLISVTQIPGPAAWKLKNLKYSISKHPMRIFLKLLDKRSIMGLGKNIERIFGQPFVNG